MTGLSSLSPLIPVTTFLEDVNQFFEVGISYNEISKRLWLTQEGYIFVFEDVI